MSSCCKNSHESFEAFHLKYTKRVYENREYIYIDGNCLLYEESVLRWRTLSTEIFRIFPAPFDFSLFSRNIELFIGRSQRYQKGEKQKYVCVRRLLGSNLLSVTLKKFWSHFSKICSQTSCLFQVLFTWSSSGTRITELLARQQSAGLFIIID